MCVFVVGVVFLCKIFARAYFIVIIISLRVSSSAFEFIVFGYVGYVMGVRGGSVLIY